MLFIAFVAVIGLHKTGIYRFDFLKDIYKKIDFQLSTNELNIPQDALSFSVYDIEQEEYLFYEGDSQLPTVASLAKLFAIDYALGKVDLEDIVEVNQEVLELVPAGSSLANLYAGEYTVKQIMEAMLVPSGNDAAYVLAYHIAKNELGEGYTATEYIDYFMTELSEYLIEAGYSKTNLYNDPSGASMQADSHLDDINRVALKLLNYDFVKECIGKSEFSIQTPQGESILYTQLFNLLCDKADDVYGGRLPVHVRCLLDEFANIGQIPKFEKLIATIRSREISASIILQSQSQLKAIYKDNADTIVGNCDTTLFLGGKEKTTLKEMSEILGKETIDSFNTSETRGRELSHGLNYQKLGKQLMSEDEIAVMDGGKCILQLRGVRPFFSEKYDITKHPKYKYLSDFDKKNAFDMEKHLRRHPAIVKPDEVFDYYEVDEADLQEDAE